MPVTSITTDPEWLTMTVVADFPVAVGRLWDAYVDPRQLERFWGPPTYPAQFTRHDFVPGGLSVYAMTGPEGETHGGYWEWVSVEPRTRFEVVDGFARPDGTPNPELPTSRIVFEFESTAQGSRLTTTSHFQSAEALEELLSMGMDEGLREAMGQMDAVLADLRSFAADLATCMQILSDTQVRISRVFDGSIDQIWRAHHDPTLLQQWLLGPDGWTMPVCHVAQKVGDEYRYEWESTSGQDTFGFEGELVESMPPFREVTTEKMIGMPGPGTVNELTLTPTVGGTLLTLVITYPDVELRDTILATGMTDGMEVSYQRLESMIR